MDNSEFVFELKWGSVSSRYTSTLLAMQSIDNTLEDIPYNAEFGKHSKEIYEMAFGMLRHIMELETVLAGRDKEITELREKLDSLLEKES